MPRYLEYDKNSGRIVSEIISTVMPEVSGNYEVLELENDSEIDTSLYAVNNGHLVKLYETNEERYQREQFRKENQERVRERVKTMMYETVMAILDDNNEALQDLKSEYRKLKVYL